MDPHELIFREPCVALAPTDEGYLAYDSASARLHRLNPTAALILELSDGTRTYADVAAQVASLIGEGAQDGCARWIETAATDGLLKVLRPGDPLPAESSPHDFVFLASQLRSEGHVLAAFVCQHFATFLIGDEPDQWLALGELAHIVGRRDDARDAYERYSELSPGDAEVEQILVSLRDAAPPPRAPDRCIVQLYARFAEFYEQNMCGDLEYQGPAKLSEALDAELDATTDLDVVDLGCGTGLAGPQLRRRARRLVGIDLSPDMVARAATTGVYDELEVAELTEWLTRSTGTEFDLIAACDTLIYFGDLRQVLTPAAHRVRGGGRIAFTVERGDSAPFQLTDSGRYVHTESHVRAAADDAGLTVSSVRETVLRYEYGEPVAGLVVVLRRG
jgi:predicted TPR repeat methyltransferase